MASLLLLLLLVACAGQPLLLLVLLMLLLLLLMLLRLLRVALGNAPSTAVAWAADERHTAAFAATTFLSMMMVSSLSGLSRLLLQLASSF